MQSTVLPYIDLNTTLYTHAEHSPTETVYIKYYRRETSKQKTGSSSVPVCSLRLPHVQCCSPRGFHHDDDDEWWWWYSWGITQDDDGGGDKTTTTTMKMMKCKM